MVVHNAIYNTIDTYTGARATPELVGRDAVLAQIRAAIHDDSTQTHVVYITGQGGIGKTRIVKEVLQFGSDTLPVVYANNVIDLYHTRIRSIGGLIGALLETVPLLNSFLTDRPKDTHVISQIQTMLRLEQEGVSLTELFNYRQELTPLFVDALNQFTQTHRLVIALDTIERLFVERDITQARLGLQDRHPIVLDWLLYDFIPHLNNAVILLAGRPDPQDLTEVLTQQTEAAGQQFSALHLEGLSEADALAYFDVVINSAESHTQPADHHTAQAISQWTETERRTIFYCLCDSGTPPKIRPILLALAIDHLVVAGQPLAAFSQALTAAQHLTAAQRHDIQQQLGQVLLQTLHQHRRPADDIIINLGWLRKGASADLLTRIIEPDHPTEIDEGLAKLSDLSFIKMRYIHGEWVYFLHDEIYNLLQIGLHRVPDHEHEHVFRTVVAYYEEQIAADQALIEKLYQRDEEDDLLPDPTRLIEVTTHLEDARVDILYYYLRWDAAEGFEVYYRFAEEAFYSSNESLGVLLESELASFLAEKDPTSQQATIDRLQRADVIADRAIRWVKWLYLTNEFQQALDIVALLHTAARDLLEPAGALALAERDAMEGMLLTAQDDYTQAEKLLIQAIDTLKQLPTATHGGRWAGILAMAYNALGYLYSRWGRPFRASQAYERALPLWRTANIQVALANTLNNRSFDLAELGLFDAALQQVRNGLQLREQLGPRSPVIYSLSTLTQVYIRQNNLDRALRSGQRALSLANRLNSPRAKGLTLLGLAEVKRRLSQEPSYIRKHVAATWLEQALDDSKEAVRIFEEDVDEKARLAEALLETGKTYRDWVNLRRHYPEIISDHERKFKRQYSIVELVSLSEASLGRAITLAEHLNQTHLQVNGLIDMGVLWSYDGIYVDANTFDPVKTNIETNALAKAHDLIPLQYHLRPDQTTNQDMLRGDLFFVYLSKIELLRGSMDFIDWQRHHQNNADLLYEAIRHYTLSMEYAVRFIRGEVFQAMRQAMIQIYNHLSMLDANEMRRAYDIVAQVQGTYQLGYSRMNKFMEDRFGPADLLL